MKPAIRQGDLIVSYQLNKNYVFHDLVAIVQDGKKQVGRVVAVEGDIVDIDGEGLKINGMYVQESDIPEKNRTICRRNFISGHLKKRRNISLKRCERTCNRQPHLRGSK